MTAHLISQTGIVPPATKLSVAKAYESVLALCEPGRDPHIDLWDNDGDPIIRQFGQPEAWIISRPQPGGIVVCAIHVGRKSATKLRAELAAAKTS